MSPETPEVPEYMKRYKKTNHELIEAQNRLKEVEQHMGELVMQKLYWEQVIRDKKGATI